jgi:hypothetical protein
VPEPNYETLSYWLFDGVTEATDGCTIEPDAVCEHGHPSWFRRLGLVFGQSVSPPLEPGTERSG